MQNGGEYINGFIERKSGGRYEGEISVDGVNLSPISAVSFKHKQDGKTYMWLRRKDMLVYDDKTQQYVTKKREPRWEAYLEKKLDGSCVAYRGEFHFMMFKYEIQGVWDSVLGVEKSRMNFYIERLPIERQDIINGINERKNEQ